MVIKQAKGECTCHDAQLATYVLHVQKLEKEFEVLDRQHVPCGNNAVTDELSTKASLGLRCQMGSSSENYRDQ
jgi:hypothetical protein